MKIENIVIVGASSGIGIELTKKLIASGCNVWGAARRIEPITLLMKSANPGSLRASHTDISKFEEVKKLADEIKMSGFIPDVVVINAGIYRNDMEENIAIEACEEIMNTNFFGAIYCVNAFKPIISPSGQFIAISSSSALKGSAFEGASYAASKAALTAAFESFYMKWSKTGPMFTTIFYGPLDSSLRRTQGGSIFETSASKAVQTILDAIQQRKPVYSQPGILFFLLRLAKVLPSRIYLAFLSYVESRMNQTPREISK